MKKRWYIYLLVYFFLVMQTVTAAEKNGVKREAFVQYTHGQINNLCQQNGVFPADLDDSDAAIMSQTLRTETGNMNLQVVEKEGQLKIFVNGAEYFLKNDLKMVKLVLEANGHGDECIKNKVFRQVVGEAFWTGVKVTSVALTVFAVYKQIIEPRRQLK